MLHPYFCLPSLKGKWVLFCRVPLSLYLSGCRMTAIVAGVGSGLPIAWTGWGIACVSFCCYGVRIVCECDGVSYVIRYGMIWCVAYGIWYAQRCALRCTMCYLYVCGVWYGVVVCIVLHYGMLTALPHRAASCLVIRGAERHACVYSIAYSKSLQSKYDLDLIIYMNLKYNNHERIYPKRS